MSSGIALVFGCDGQDGSLMSKSLLEKGYKVYGTINNSETRSKNLQKLGIDPDSFSIPLDIRSYSNVLNIISTYLPNEIYNLAAKSSVGKSFEHPYETIQINTIGTLNILEACKKINFKGRIFFAGSSEIFGSNNHAANINTSRNAMSPYAVSKVASQNLVKMYRETYGLNAVTGVLFNHESKLRDEKFIIPKIIKAARESVKKPNHIIRVGNINIERDWGWAEEYVEAMQFMTRAKEISDQVICTGKKTSLEYVIRRIFEKYNLNWKDHVVIDKNLFRPNDIITSFGDPNQTFQNIGWKATIFIEEIIDNLIKLK